MGRPAITDEQRHEMRQRIRHEAFELFREGGFDAVSIRAVAARIGKAPSAIYSYFKNRNELVQAIWYEPAAAATIKMLRMASETPDPLARIEKALRIYIELAHEHPEIYREAFLFVRPRSEEPPTRHPISELDFHKVLSEAIRDAQNAGRAKVGDASLMAQVLWAGLHGALALPINIDGWQYAPSDLLVEEMLQTLIAGVVCREDTSSQ